MSSPKATIKNIIQVITTTIDDGTAADIITLYEGGPETLRYLFFLLDYDVVVTIDDPNVVSQRDIQDVPEHYAELHPVTVTSVDKAGVTATRMEAKMLTQMRAVIEDAAHGSNYTLKIIRESSSNRRKGGIDRVWETTYWVQYRDA